MKQLLSISGLLLFSFLLQEFLPVFDWSYGARPLLVHAFFLSAAVAIPFPAMLLLATVCGFLWDARYYIPIYSHDSLMGAIGQAELPFGFTIFLFALAGLLIQGVRPYFRRGRWELPVFMIGLCTGFILLLEYLLICFHRGTLELPPQLWSKLLMTSLFSALLAPVLLLLLAWLAGRLRFRTAGDDFKRRHPHDGDAL